MSQILFYFFSALVILSALRTVTSTKPVYALLSMIICLLSISGLFFVVGAHFAGAIEIVVYAGAIMVLFVFVLMMLNLGRSTYQHEKELFSPRTWILPTIAALLVCIGLISLITSADNGLMVNANAISSSAVGFSLYSVYLLLVEASALILLAALVVAYHIAKKSTNECEELTEEFGNE